MANVIPTMVSITDTVIAMRHRFMYPLRLMLFMTRSPKPTGKY
jgi:hypothetical protein